MRILALKGRVWKIVHYDVGIHAVPFDQPFSLRTVHAVLRRGSNSLVDQAIRRRQPDLAAPGPHSDHFSEPEPPEAFGKSLAIGGRPLVAQHHNIAAECFLHVPVRLAGARLPEHPRLAHQLAQNPTVDVAAAVVANVHYQSLPVVHGRVVFHPGVDVVWSHSAKVDVADLPFGGFLHFEAARVFPFVIAKVLFHLQVDRLHYDIPRLGLVFRLKPNQHLPAGLVAK